MSKVVSVRLKEDQIVRLGRHAERMGKSHGEAAAQFIEESMREAEFRLIEFRDTVLGRQPYMKGSRLGVWQMIDIARDLEMSAERTAEYLQRPCYFAQAALDYYQAYPEAIDKALAKVDAIGFEELKQMLPNIQQFVVPESFDADNTAKPC